MALEMAAFSLLTWSSAGLGVSRMSQTNVEMSMGVVDRCLTNRWSSSASYLGRSDAVFCRL